MFVVYCSSVNHILAVSIPPFLLEIIFSPEISESFEKMDGYITDQLNTHQIHLSNF